MRFGSLILSSLIMSCSDDEHVAGIRITFVASWMAACNDDCRRLLTSAGQPALRALLITYMMGIHRHQSNYLE
jgi:hypothetical protein